MAIDTHLKLDGVTGESTHAEHKGEIELITWDWSVSNESSAGSGGGSGKGKAKPGALTFAHNYDKSSPVLAKSCAAGKHFKDGTITCRKAGEGQKDFLKITLKEVFVTGVHPSAHSGGDVSELVTLSYSDIEFAYKAQDDKGGLGGEVKFGWNIASTETR